MSEGKTPPSPSGLERRIRALEDGDNEGADLGAAEWVALVLLSVLAPSLLILWGWPG